MAPDIELVRDVSRGTTSIRAARQKYLPQHPAERSDDYAIRLNRSVLFNAFGRTIAGLVGMVFRRDPLLGDDVPPEIVELSENIDANGTHIAVFAKTVFGDALEVGHAAILVDAPVTDGERLSIGQERDRGIRPFLVHIRAEDIVSWRTITVNGVEILSQVVLREIVIRPDGAFGEERIERFRVLQRDNGVIRFEIWEKKDEAGAEPEKTGEEGIIQNVTEIPLVPIYARKVGLLTSIPPLIDLAHTNITHYQVLSDHLHALHKASVPILVLAGAGLDEDAVVGPNMAINLPEGATVSYVEHGGSALAATSQQLKDLKTDMAVLGLGMLQHETRAAETAEAKRMDKSEQDSVLATAARSMQDGMENALGFMARMLKKPAGGSVALNRDFEKLTLDAAQIQVYSQLFSAGVISIDTLWAILQEGGALNENFDPEMERDQIEDMLPPEPDIQPPPDDEDEDEDDAA